MLEFLGKLCFQAEKEGNECILIINSKIGEYAKKRHFPESTRFFSKIDWCMENYQKDREGIFDNFSWKNIFSDFDRSNAYDRFNYQDSLEMVSQLHQFIDFVFQKEKPDVVVHEIVGGLFSQVVYHLCVKHGITFLGLSSSRFPDRIDVYDSEHTCSKYEKTFEKLGQNDISAEERAFVKNFADGFVSHKKLPYYIEYHLNYAKANILAEYWKREKKMIRPWLKYYSKRKKFKPFDYESERQLKYFFWYPWKALRQKIRAFFPKKIFSHPNYKGKFFLYPLHSQPESSTSVLAPYFCDQLNTIRNIAFALPLPYKLYVKEHPVARGERTSDFYRKLKEFPNAVLIAPNENTGELVKNSSGVITLSSTVGLEAALAGKKVYVLGNVFYSYHPLCQKVGSFEELRQEIEKRLNASPIAPDALEEINIRFLASYYRNTLPGDVRSASLEKDAHDYPKIYQEIKKIFFDNMQAPFFRS